MGGVREAVTVSGVTANQKLLLGKRNESESTVLALCGCFSLQPNPAVSILCVLCTYLHLLPGKNNPFPAAELGLYPLRVWSDRLVSGNWMGNLRFSCPTAWSLGRKQWCPSREMPLDMKELPESEDGGVTWESLGLDACCSKRTSLGPGDGCLIPLLYTAFMCP